MKFFALLTTCLTLLMVNTSHALEIKAFNEQEFAKAQSASKPVALHFHASWCPTCRKQSASIDTLKADKTLDLTIFVADDAAGEPSKHEQPGH